MPQPLWYLRHGEQAIGPYPSPQVREFLDNGSVTADWEISLDEVDWLTIRESGQFEPAHRNKFVDEDRSARREERKEARQRWLDDKADLDRAEPHDMAQERRVRQALAQDQAHTETLLLQEHARKPPLLGMLLVILLTLGAGYVVWWTQRGESVIQTEIGLTANCALPLGEAVNWNGCDKHGLAAPGASARNTRMERVNLEGADLTGADLSYAALPRANLRHARLQGINLSGADLTGADLSGSDLSLADLRFAVLKDARMDGVRLERALLGKATWPDGRLCGAEAVGECP